MDIDVTPRSYRAFVCGTLEIVRRVFAVAFAFLTLANAAAAEPARLPRDRYHLEATLNPSARRVEGVVTLDVCVPETSRPLSSLWFQTYLNAFAGAGTEFARDNGGALRGVRAGGAGGIEFRRFDVDGVSVLRSLAYDDRDRTVLRVDLERPRSPGDCLRIEADFVSTFPELWARTGYARDFFVVAQWYPKLAKLNRDGSFRAEPYRGFGEFFADIADYTFDLRAEEGWRVVAPGEGGHLDAAVDLAWVAAPSFVEETISSGESSLRIVAVPSVAGDLARVRDAAALATERFTHAYGPPPHPTLTVVIPPADAAGGAAMEYPALILAEASGSGASAWLTRDVEATVFHETAHQWFYASLATDERNSPWLDEALATWATYDLLRETGGLVRGPLYLSPFANALATLANPSSLEPPPTSPARRFTSESAYVRGVYEVPAAAIETLARRTGRPWLREALSRYARENRLSHPSAEDFWGTLRRAARNDAERAAVDAFVRTVDEGAPTDVEFSAAERAQLAVRDAAIRAADHPKATTAALALASAAVVLWCLFLRRFRRS